MLGSMFRWKLRLLRTKIYITRLLLHARQAGIKEQKILCHSSNIFSGRFNKQDIRELCPTLSNSSIEGALRKLVASGELKKEGKGKNTCYFRLN